MFRIFGVNDRSFNRVVATFAANGLMVNENCLLTTFLQKKKKNGKRGCYKKIQDNMYPV